MIWAVLKRFFPPSTFSRAICSHSHDFTMAVLLYNLFNFRFALVVGYLCSYDEVHRLFKRLNLVLFEGKIYSTRNLTSDFDSYRCSLWKKPIGIGLKNLFKYHIGTIIYGSIMITFTWPLKRMMELIRARLDKMNIKSKSFRFCLVCWSCLLNFYEQNLKYVSSRNYTQVLWVHTLKINK